ncbi:unnamed protein product [marine sediment metagenome]|uniref:Uncharacterized protein n=1 Tax=marine sediment metagenome TaxID=412755 RepID=X1JG01_9ZZZZ
MFTVITLPEDFVSSIIGYMSGLFGDLAPYITLILGVILGMLVISILINALRR